MKVITRAAFRYRVGAAMSNLNAILLETQPKNEMVYLMLWIIKNDETLRN